MTVDQHANASTVPSDRVWMTEHGDPRGAPLVLIHGTSPGSSGWAAFEPLVPFFPSRRILVLDLMLFGQSPVRTGTGPRWSFQADAIARELAERNVSWVDVIAVGSGAAIGVALAARRPDLVRAMVLCGASTPILSGQVVDSWSLEGEATTAQLRAGIEAVEWFENAAVPAETVRLRSRNCAAAGHSLLTEQGWSVLGEPEDVTGLLRELRVPILFIWGAHDPTVDISAGVSLMATADFGEMHVLAATAHHPHEERPEVFARTATSFFMR